jgi:hypothetical protein
MHRITAGLIGTFGLVLTGRPHPAGPRWVTSAAATIENARTLRRIHTYESLTKSSAM